MITLCRYQTPYLFIWLFNYRLPTVIKFALHERTDRLNAIWYIHTDPGIKYTEECKQNDQFPRIIHRRNFTGREFSKNQDRLDARFTGSN